MSNNVSVETWKEPSVCGTTCSHRQRRQKVTGANVYFLTPKQKSVRKNVSVSGLETQRRRLLAPFSMPRSICQPQLQRFVTRCALRLASFFACWSSPHFGYLAASESPVVFVKDGKNLFVLMDSTCGRVRVSSAVHQPITTYPSLIPHGALFRKWTNRIRLYLD